MDDPRDYSAMYDELGNCMVCHRTVVIQPSASHAEEHLADGTAVVETVDGLERVVPA